MERPGTGADDFCRGIEMKPVIDIHAHAFPDRVAEKAIPALEEEAIIKACSDGKISSLLSSMDAAGIETSVVASIATKPEQFGPILEWSKEIQSGRLIPFPSVHPSDPEAVEKIGRIASAGFRGLKLHPYYQGFTIDDENFLPLYKEISDMGLILLLHTGFDIAFPHDRIADPEKVLRLLDQFPDLLLISSHLGAWKDWDEAERLLLGKPVYMDTSACFDFMDEHRFRHFLTSHPKEYLLFGTDSPWVDQKDALDRIRRQGLSRERMDAVLGGNAARLLGLSGAE